MFRNETSNLNSTLKFPDLTEGRELDTLEYSHNKDDLLSITKLEQESKRFFESNRSKEQALDRYLAKTDDLTDNPPKHYKNDSLFTLSGKETGLSQVEKTSYDNSKVHIKKPNRRMVSMDKMDNQSKPPTFKTTHHSKNDSKLSMNNIKTFEVVLNEEEDDEKPDQNFLKQSIETFISFDHNPVASARSK